MIDLAQMTQFYMENEKFRDYVNKNATTYNKTHNEILASPITQEYYKSLLAGGCNHEKGADKHDV